MRMMISRNPGMMVSPFLCRGSACVKKVCLQAGP